MTERDGKKLLDFQLAAEKTAGRLAFMMYRMDSPDDRSAVREDLEYIRNENILETVDFIDKHRADLFNVHPDLRYSDKKLDAILGWLRGQN